MGDKAAEQELHRLRKLPENKECPNCGKQASTFGFTAVVVPFNIFVCDDCKSAHQSFSHRCKSATMSNWSMAEVLPLMEKNGGGNKACIAKWFVNLPPGDKPRPESHVNDKKHFVNQAYNQKLWLGNPSAAPPAAQAAAAPVAAVASTAQARHAPAVAPAPAPVASKPAAEANLLDMFEPEPVAAAPVPAAAAPVPAAPSSNLLGDMLFDPLTPSPLAQAAAPAPAPGAAQFGGGQLFAGLSPAPRSGIPSAAGAQPVPTPAAAVVPAADPFDPFATSTSQASGDALAGSGGVTGGGGSAFSFVGGAAPAAAAPQPAASAFSFVDTKAAAAPAPAAAPVQAQAGLQFAPMNQSSFPFAGTYAQGQQHFGALRPQGFPGPTPQFPSPMQGAPPAQQQQQLPQRPAGMPMQPGASLDTRWLPQQPQKAQPKQAFDIDAFATMASVAAG